MFKNIFNAMKPKTAFTEHARKVFKINIFYIAQLNILKGTKINSYSNILWKKGISFKIIENF